MRTLRVVKEPGFTATAPQGRAAHRQRHANARSEKSACLVIGVLLEMPIPQPAADLLDGASAAAVSDGSPFGENRALRLYDGRYRLT